jgi:ABC-type sugar transport systems, ATPase components
VAGVRPEDVKVLSGEQNAIAARVDVSELMGSETYLHVDIQGEEAVLVVPTNSVSNRIEQIDISFNENKIHLFDPDTEKNLFV